jgi:hypothetical protein
MPEIDAQTFKDYFYGRFALSNHWQAFEPVAKYLNTLKANQRFHHLFPILQDVHQYPYEFQKVAAGLMMKVDAACPVNVGEAALPVLDTIDLSVQEFPFFLAKRHGRDRVLQDLGALSSPALSEPQRKRLDTLIYWTRGFTEDRYEQLRQLWSARIKG